MDRDVPEQWQVRAAACLSAEQLPRHGGSLRVPALLASASGTLYLVHDHRPVPAGACLASGGALPDDLPNPNSLWLRRSHDAGQTWSVPEPLVPGQDGGRSRAVSACPGLAVAAVSDPSLLEAPDGTIHLFAAGASDVGLFGAHPPTAPWSPHLRPEPGTIRLLHATSRDDARTWRWEDLTDLCLPGPGFPDGVVLFPVSGHGTRSGSRLIQPAVGAGPARADGSRPLSAVPLISDDAGSSWSLGAPIPQPQAGAQASLAGGAVTSGVDEWAVAALPDGELVVSARDGGYGGTRLVTRLEPGGGWQVPVVAPDLPDPGCNGALALLPDGALVCTHAADPHRRRRGTISLSSDAGRTWRDVARMGEGPFAYSDVAVCGREVVVVCEDPQRGCLRVWRCHAGERGRMEP